MNEQFEENFNKIEEHFSKIEASLKRSKGALDCIGEALKDITVVVYEAYLQEQRKPHNPSLKADKRGPCKFKPKCLFSFDVCETSGCRYYIPLAP
jgi:hypothetical protein